MAFILAIALGATGVLTPKGQRTALGASTTLSILSGAVQIRHGATGAFVAADDGAILSPGDAVRTGTDARAVLTYFEGSTVEIEPDSEIAIETAHGNPDGSTVIVMQQELGTTWHVVTHLVQGGSKYEVHTTASTASVRGTEFTVGVAADRTTSVTTTEGDVATSDAASTKVVDVTPGLTTTTKPGEKPEDPKPAPTPLRKVTVTVGDLNTLVVDTLGRANGIKDGKKIVQTPGAQVAVVDGKLVVTLPNLPDGDISTHFLDTKSDKNIDVSTKVEEQGKKTVEVNDIVKPSARSTSNVELKKSAADADQPTVKTIQSGGEKQPKVGDILPTPITQDQKDQKDQQKAGDATGSTGAGDENTNTKNNSDGGTPTDKPTDKPKTNAPGPTGGNRPAERSADPTRGVTNPPKATGDGSGLIPLPFDLNVIPKQKPDPPPKIPKSNVRK